jgi:hypothetical protein
LIFRRLLLKNGRRREMHKIHWTEIQRKIAELVIQGKSYKDLREAGYGCENIELVIRAIRRGETPPTPPNFEIPAVPRGPRPGSNEPYDLPGPGKAGGHAIPPLGHDIWGGNWPHAIDLMKQIIKEVKGMNLTSRNQYAVDLMGDIIKEKENPEEVTVMMSIPKKEIDEMFVLASRPVEVTYHPGEELAMAQNAYRICTLRLERFANWLHPSRFGGIKA